MDFHEMIVKRRSIRRFKDNELNSDDVKLLLEAALIAPSSKMSRPWHFILVDDADMLQRLSETRAMGAGPIAKSCLAIVVCADSRLTGAWIEDATIAATYIQLQAQALGLGSCWIQVRDRFDKNGQSTDELIQELLHIPEEISVECVVVLGYPDEEKKPQNLDALLWERVHIGTWDSKDPS